jgi:hypothetical protein
MAAPLDSRQNNNTAQRFGTATYLPMADGATYHVSLNTPGLFARPMNAAARRAVKDWE